MKVEFAKLCATDEISESALRSFQVGGETVILVRLNDEYFVLSGVCTHDFNDLETAELIDSEIECPRHGSRFDVRTGEATRMPAIFGLEVYQTRIVNGDVFVSLYSAELSSAV